MRYILYKHPILFFSLMLLLAMGMVRIALLFTFNIEIMIWLIVIASIIIFSSAFALKAWWKQRVPDHHIKGDIT